MIGICFLGAQQVAHAAETPASGQPNGAVAQAQKPVETPQSDAAGLQPAPVSPATQPAPVAQGAGTLVTKPAPVAPAAQPVTPPNTKAPVAPAKAPAKAVPDNEQVVEVTPLQPYWTGHDPADPAKFIKNYASLRDVASVTWNMADWLQQDDHGMLNVTMTVSYKDGTVTKKDLALAAYAKSVILKFIDKNTGKPFPMHYSPDTMDNFNQLVYGFVPQGGTFHIAQVEYEDQGLDAPYAAARFLPIQPGYAIAKITSGSPTGPTVSVDAIKYTENPVTYYVQMARFKDILVKGVDEAGHQLYQYRMATDTALPAATSQGYKWQGGQYAAVALAVPHYRMDETKLPANAKGA